MLILQKINKYILVFVFLCTHNILIHLMILKHILKCSKLILTIFFQCNLSLPPENIRKPRGWKKGASGTNGLIYPHNLLLQYCTDIFFAAKEEG